VTNYSKHKFLLFKPNDGGFLSLPSFAAKSTNSEIPTDEAYAQLQKEHGRRKIESIQGHLPKRSKINGRSM
jgi:hypothetical protein